MEKESFKPIRASKEQLWRQFRTGMMPWIVLVLAIVATVFVWKQASLSPTAMGEVQGAQMQIICTQPSIVEALLVEQMGEVKKGDVVAILKPTDPTISLNAIRSQLNILSAKERLDTTLTRQRAEADYYSLRLDLLTKQVDLAQAKAELERAERDLARNEVLVKENYVSLEQYDLVLATRNQAKETVAAIEAKLPALETGVEELEKRILETDKVDTEMVDALNAIDAELKQTMAGAGNEYLRSPIDGTVSGLYCAEKQKLPEDFVLMQINATKSDHILAYLRQPFALEPTVGMTAKILTHSSRRVVAESEVDNVGHYLEPITNSLARLAPEQLVDMGLPITVKIPPGIDLRPGETVGLILEHRH